MVNMAKCLHPFFPSHLWYAKAVLFTLLQYIVGRQIAKVPFYACPFNFSITMDRNKPPIICPDLHQEPLISPFSLSCIAPQIQST